MGYYEFTLTVDAESTDALEQRLHRMGCLGIVEQDGRIIAYFPDVLGIGNIVDGINEFRTVLSLSGLGSNLTFRYEFLSERDWNESWKKKFQPIDVGDRLIILPPWAPPREGRINIIIDPGMAFGTGHHETTKTCLLLIEKLSRRLRCGRFLDVGTGTGILAIGAAKLGFREVVGVDTDPLAVDAALRNMALNGIGNAVMLLGTITEASGRYDLIAANLMSDILIGVAPDIAARLEPRGRALLSGMIAGQEEDVMPAMDRAGLRCMKVIPDGRWVSLVIARKKGSPLS
ncbi:MAG TPA: 50S ribosomal protein L11 methyltransferase [Dissulfurispiraceae bacterium]|nr:50S ribosomal protein L11 methyltransferase [Dissulfurispiraceae bacterium]